MTLEALKARSRKALTLLARRQGLDGWHSMTKEELVRALVRIQRSKSAAQTTRRRKSRSAARREVTRSRGASRAASLRLKVNGHLPATRTRDLCTTEVADRTPRGRTNYLDASVCDAHWLRAEWDLTRDSIRRAETRLSAQWHRAVPVLRLFEVLTDDAGATSERFVKDWVIEGGVNTWYVNVPGDGRTFRLHIGYRTEQGTFFAVAKSNPCAMPVLNVNRPDEGNGKPGAARGETHSARHRDSGPGSDGRLGRPLGFSSLSHFGPAATVEREQAEFSFKLDTELIVHGSTRPGSNLVVEGGPIELRDDGSFTIRVNQPEGRQVITLTAMSPTGSERRMIVLAMERNTRELERQYFDGGHPEGFSE